MRAKPGSGNRKVVANHKKRMKSNFKLGKKRKKGCYIASCVYGSYDCPEVWVLRRYRDKVLEHSLLGRLFIAIYYLISPVLVTLFGDSSLFRKLFKSPLDRLVAKLKSQGFFDTPYND